MPVTVGVRVGTALIAFIYFLVAGVSNLYGDKPLEVSNQNIIYHIKAKVGNEEIPTDVKIPKDKNGKPKEKGVKINYKKNGEEFEINFEHDETPLSDFDKELIKNAFDTINNHNKSIFRKIIDSKTANFIGVVLKNIWKNQIANKAFKEGRGRI